jgi:hypothetical protein
MRRMREECKARLRLALLRGVRIPHRPQGRRGAIVAGKTEKRAFVISY